MQLISPRSRNESKVNDRAVLRAALHKGITNDAAIHSRVVVCGVARRLVRPVAIVPETTPDQPLHCVEEKRACV